MKSSLKFLGVLLFASATQAATVDPSDSAAILKTLKANFCAEKGIESADYSFYSFGPAKMQDELVRLRDERDFAKYLKKSSGSEDTIEGLKSKINYYKKTWSDFETKAAKFKALSDVYDTLTSLLAGSIAMNQLSNEDRENLITILNVDMAKAEKDKAEFASEMPADLQDLTESNKKYFTSNLAKFDSRIARYKSAVESIESSSGLSKEASEVLSVYTSNFSTGDADYNSKYNADSASYYKKHFEQYQAKLAALEESSKAPTSESETLQSLEKEILADLRPDFSTT